MNAGVHVVAAMRTHRADARVQENACVALRNLSTDNSRNSEILVQDLNAGADIVAAMRAHRQVSNF